MQAAINITTFLRNWEIVQDPCGWGPGQNLTTGNDKEPIVQYMSLNLFKNAEHAFTQYTSTEFKWAGGRGQGKKYGGNTVQISPWEQSSLILNQKWKSFMCSFMQ